MSHFLEKDSNFLVAISMGVDNKEVENMGLGNEFVFSGHESFGSSSSSSDLSTLVGSELDSTEIWSSEEDDDEFMAELTRQMADYMLQEDDNDEDNKNGSEKSGIVDSENFKEEDGEGILKSTNSVVSISVKESNNIVGYHSSPADQMQPVQLYQVENQPRVANSGTKRMGRKESTQLQHQDKKMGRGPKLPIGGIGLSNTYNYGKGYPPNVVGSGMRAVFLGGRVGSTNASSGTGVFLPRTITPSPNQPPKKSGCSTVLIPTRVLQVLEQHFSNIKSPSCGSNGLSSQHGRRDSTHERGQAQSLSSSKSKTMTIDHQVSLLPQEWTY